MFHKNQTHIQQSLFGVESNLSKAKLAKLHKSKEYAFYQLVFCKIDESLFMPIFSESGSRPNAPVNTLVSASLLKDKKGWSTEEMLEHIDFDLLTRTALGLASELDVTPFCETTFYNFQKRLSEYQAKTGIDLLESVFDKLTADQLKTLKIRTDIQRCDSFQAMSNIRSYNRTELLIEVLIRLHRVMSESEKILHKDLLEPYTSSPARKYVYRLKTTDISSELDKLGRVYHTLYEALKGQYGNHEVFKVFERVYHEHFTVASETITINKPDSSFLQSPDDPDATYRAKNNKGFRGQVVNVSETANPENKLNLIVDVAVASNNIDDSAILNDRLESMHKKTPDLVELHTDGGYGSADNDVVMAQNNILQIQTAIRGRNAEVAMEIVMTDTEEFLVSCPYQKNVQAKKTKTRNVVLFDNAICQSCDKREVCCTLQQKDGRAWYFDDAQYLAYQRQQRINLIPVERRGIRANVEATMKEYTALFNHKNKLRYRGRFKTMLHVCAMSICINFGRIYRYLVEKMESLGLAGLFALIYTAIRLPLQAVRAVRAECSFYKFRFFKERSIFEKKSILLNFRMATF
jgi:hypothetical protein